MFGRLKWIALAVVVIGVVGAGLMLAQAYDLRTNYTLVDAKIMSVETECFIESGKEKIVNKDSETLAYMDCDLAPLVAKQHGFKESAIQRRVTVSYDYRSPVDGQIYSGDFRRTGDVEGVKRGKMIQVHAHKTDPKDSRTTRSNLFIQDTGA